MGPPSPDPHPLLLQTEQWFSRARAALLGALPCHRGCSRCCIGVFPITILDAVEISKGLATLPDADQIDIQARARSQVRALEERFPRLKHSVLLDEWQDTEVDAVAEQFGDLPCPALAADGSCRMYRFRPVACRTMGVPVDSGGFESGACEVQTAIPIIRLSRALRTEESWLIDKEASALSLSRQEMANRGEELLLQHGFLFAASDARPLPDSANAGVAPPKPTF